MTQNPPGGDQHQRPELISRLPWDDTAPTSRYARPGGDPEDEGEATVRVSRAPQPPNGAGSTPTARPTQMPPATPSGQLDSSARPAPYAGGPPQPNRGHGVPLGTPPKQVPTSPVTPDRGSGPSSTSGRPPVQPAPHQPGRPQHQQAPTYPGQSPNPQPPRTSPQGHGPQGNGPQQPATAPAQPDFGGVSVPQPSHPAPAGTGQPGYPPRYGVNDLIDQLNPEVQAKSKKGWRARLGLKPSQRELAEQRDDESVRMPFARPVTIMVANPKGGVGKTPTTLMLAAAMGVARGGGVIAWDNNELRGTMPDRSLSPHRRTVRDMLSEAEFLSQPSAQFTDLSYYFNHQTTGKFHTLGSAQTSGHVISRDDFESIHNILSRFFQVIIVDTGNNEASPNWQAAAEEADCLVVPTKWRKDSLIPAARMLETLQELNSDLLNRTVVVATNGPADSQQSVRLSGAEFFGSYPIVEVPTDPHIAEGGVIDYLKLQESTRRAALALAAEVARAIEPVAGLSTSRGPGSPRRRR